jgi:hypothetical protein
VHTRKESVYHSQEGDGGRMKMEKEIEINGKKYVLKDTINKNKTIKSKKGLTYCVIRTYSAGIFAGWIDRKTKGQSRTIYNARRLWYWKTTGLDCSTIAEIGVVSKDCKFSEVREEIDLENVIEIQPCTEKAKETIDAVEVYKNA